VEEGVEEEGAVQPLQGGVAVGIERLQRVGEGREQLRARAAVVAADVLEGDEGAVVAVAAAHAAGEVEDVGDVLEPVARTPEAETDAELAAPQVEAGERPDVEHVDPANTAVTGVARLPDAAPQLLGGDARLDGAEDVGLAVEDVETGEDDVGRGGDQRRLDLGATEEQLLRALLVADEEVVEGENGHDDDDISVR